MISAARRARILAGLGCAPAHAPLLAAALAPDDAAFGRAWAAWRAGGGTLDGADAEARRLLAALPRRLARVLPADPDLERLRGLHRRALYWYQMMAHRAGAVVDALAARGIPVLVLKGAALVARYGLDPGTRPMGDVDLAVPGARAAEALAALDALGHSAAGGWRPSEPATHAEMLAQAHARNFQHADGYGVDLHWNLLLEAAYPGADAPFWDAAVPGRWHERPVLFLAPTDQLFHGLVQDAAHDRPPSPHGLLDAAAVLAREHVDATRLVAHAERLHQVLPLEAALRALAQAGVAVPAGALEALTRAPVPALDALYHEVRRRPRGLPWSLIRVLSNYWFRRGRARGPVQALCGLPAYVRAVYRTAPRGGRA